MKLRPSSSPATSSELIDAVMDAYVSWREQCAAVEVSYRIWSSAAPDQRTCGYRDYTAALDREELAANEYRRRVERAAASVAVRRA